MSLCCVARLESGLVGAMLQSWCWREFGCGCDRGLEKECGITTVGRGSEFIVGKSLEPLGLFPSRLGRSFDARETCVDR